MRFSKAALRAYIERREKAIQFHAGEHGVTFDRDKGSSQVAGQEEAVVLLYGQFMELELLAERLEDSTL